MSTIETKIKNFLQANQLIGKIDPSVPKILLNTLEIFLFDVLIYAQLLVKKLKKNTIRTKHVKYVLKKKTKFSQFDHSKI